MAQGLLSVFIFCGGPLTGYQVSVMVDQKQKSLFEIKVNPRNEMNDYGIKFPLKIQRMKIRN